MIRLSQRITESGYTSAQIAKMAGVRRSAISDYRACRYDKCGKEAKKKIDEVLFDLGIKKRPDPKRNIRRKLMEFHRAGGGLSYWPHPFGLGHIPDSEIDEMIFGTIK